MAFNHCTECRANFDNAQAFVEHHCNPDAVRRERMRQDVIAMAERAERRYWLQGAPDPYGEQITWDEYGKWLTLADECREFAKELGR